MLSISSSVSFNVHCLLHLDDALKNFELLDTCSPYKTENYMQVLKRMLRKPSDILQQFHRLLHEIHVS